MPEVKFLHVQTGGAVINDEGDAINDWEGSDVFIVQRFASSGLIPFVCLQEIDSFLETCLST